MKNIIASITSLISIEKETLDILTGHLHPMQVKKKTVLIKPAVKDDNVYIIEKGIARAYLVINGKEVTSWFSKEGELLFSTNSFYGET